MNFIKTKQDLLFKAGGGAPVVYRSSDYPALTSGSTQTITFLRETSSVLLHNRSAYDSNNTILFYLNDITHVPVTLEPGENISLGKAWATSVIIQPSANDPIWQVVITL